MPATCPRRLRLLGKPELALDPDAQCEWQLWGKSGLSSPLRGKPDYHVEKSQVSGPDQASVSIFVAAG